MIHLLHGFFFPLMLVLVLGIIQVFFVGDYVLTDLFVVAPVPGQTREQWLANDFFQVVLYIQTLALLFHMFWYGWGWRAKIDSFTRASLRSSWLVIFTVYSVLAFVLSFYWTQTLQEGGGVTMLFLSFVGIVSVYFTSAWCSFVSIKYAPIGAMYLRR